MDGAALTDSGMAEYHLPPAHIVLQERRQLNISFCHAQGGKQNFSIILVNA